MATPKKPPDEDPLKRLLQEAGAEIDARLRDWIAKSSGKPANSSAKPGATGPAAGLGKASSFPPPSPM